MMLMAGLTQGEGNNLKNNMKRIYGSNCKGLLDNSICCFFTIFTKYLLAIIIIKNTKINNNRRHLLHPNTSCKLLYVRKHCEVLLKPFHNLTLCTEIKKKKPGTRKITTLDVCIIIALIVTIMHLCDSTPYHVNDPYCFLLKNE